ncbi:MAG: hypothetical protein AAGA70_04405 [Pseudomonadota bacterium]
MLTGAVLPDTTLEGRAALAIGVVERAYLRALESLCGAATPLELVCDCPECGQMLEFQITTRAIWSVSAGRAVPDNVIVSHKGRKFEISMPTLGVVGANGLDLVALAPDAPWDDPEFRATVEDALSEADPLLGPEMALQCAACGHEFSLPVDLAALLWQQVANTARPLMQEVIRLSRALGWSEQDILAMPAARRRLYLSELGA